MPINSLNLKQLDGGTTIKQGDFSSNFKFELLDENNNIIDNLNGQEAVITLGRGGEVQWRKIATVADNTVSFKIDEILEPATYILEISVGGYVFPSDASIKLKVKQANGTYSPKPLGSDSLTNPATIKLIKELVGAIELNPDNRAFDEESIKQIIKQALNEQSPVETLTQEQVETIVNQAIANIPRPDVLTSSEVETMIVNAISAIRIPPTLSKQQVTEIVDEKVSQLPSPVSESRINDMISTAIQGIQFPDTVTEEEVSEKIRQAIESLPPHETIDLAEIEQIVQSKIDSIEIPKGDKGDIGEQGIQGLPGPQGERGEPGERGSQGERGEPGERGAQGERGEQGLQGERGADGQNGKSAYEIAVEYGFDGSEAEWLESLKAPSSQSTQLRHGPTGYHLDKSTPDWILWFDNGAGLRLNWQTASNNPGQMAGLFGVGKAHPFESKSNQLVADPLTYNIIRTSTGIVSTDVWAKTTDVAKWWDDRTEILNPVNDPAQFNWDNAKYNPSDTNTTSLDRQKTLIKCYYALGVWSETDVIGFGAVKK